MKHVCLTNSMSKEKQPIGIITDHDNVITLYVCGITPYDAPHIGHGRCYTTFDVLYRLLEFLKYRVIYCRNFTDIDDKLIQKSKNEFGTPYKFEEIAKRYIAIFERDMELLNCKEPTYEPRVTQTIAEIIAFVQALIDAGKAYIVDGDVYFSIDAYPEYGALSHRNLEDLQPGARIALSEKKRNPLDFALWKSEPNGDYYVSPWGNGRPGWHIECSAMAKKFLGKTIDIHGGGMDLIFPHHENELAQSQSIQKEPFVKLWAHNAFVQINKEKMSKSLGNFFLLDDIFKHYDPQAVRFYFLQHHYRNPLDFSLHDLEVAQKSYTKLAKQFAAIEKIYSDIPYSLITHMLDFLKDDLNTPGMLGVFYKHSDEIFADAILAGQVKTVFQDILGLTLIPLPEKIQEITPEIKELLEARIAARVAKNWKKSDELRDQLKSLGYDVQDKKI
ncbi:MAG: cysteine--tRNA ligase [Candidatus Babeliaceae bacterium]|nr:cysteine--tRNA ligase [Candidatus Babeliaceae bacterium]